MVCKGESKVKDGRELVIQTQRYAAIFSNLMRSKLFFLLPASKENKVTCNPPEKHKNVSG
jgi:hypothetical protein